MADTLSNFSERVNRAAYHKYLKNRHNQQFQHEIAEKIRQGERRQLEEAEYWHSRGHIKKYQLHERATPYGQRKHDERRVSPPGLPARSSPSESYLYEGLKSPLVNHAKSQSGFFQSIDEKTGEIHELSVGKSGEILVQNFDEKSYRVEQYALQNEAREILKSITRNNGKTVNHPVYRVCNCLRSSSNGEGVGVVKSSSSDRVRFSGLQTCGSVWHCPVCSARISEFRASEIRYMCDMWQSAGGTVIFVTNTLRHAFDDDLRMVLEVLFGQVWNRYINHWSYKKLREELGYIGRVRSVEVTHGSNGWHPHVHEIWLIRKKLSSGDLNRIKRILYSIWNITLVNSGLRPVSLKRGVTVQPGSNAADYVAKFGKMPKWDLGKDLTKAHIKKGRASSRTPFDLLRDSLAGDKNASRLFLEYAVAFSGKRQLYFSTGLKDFFCLREKSDLEISKSQDDVIQVLTTLTNSDWKTVLIYGDRATLLNVAESGGQDAIAIYINELKKLQKSSKVY